MTAFMLAIAVVLAFAGGFSTSALIFYMAWARKHLEVRADDAETCPLCGRCGLCSHPRHDSLAQENANLVRELHLTRIKLDAATAALLADCPPIRE